MRYLIPIAGIWSAISIPIAVGLGRVLRVNASRPGLGAATVDPYRGDTDPQLTFEFVHRVDVASRSRGSKVLAHATALRHSQFVRSIRLDHAARPSLLHEASRRVRPGGRLFLGVDQWLAERPRRRARPELADPVRPVEVGQPEDVQELDAGCLREGLDPLAERLLHLLEGHASNASTTTRHSQAGRLPVSRASRRSRSACSRSRSSC